MKCHANAVCHTPEGGLQTAIRDSTLAAQGGTGSLSGERESRLTEPVWREMAGTVGGEKQ